MVEAAVGRTFVSRLEQSWHDVGPAKFAALTAWADKFIVHERAPLLWLGPPTASN